MGSLIKAVLAIGAHPDDIELGCGASLARLSEEGYHIIALVMTVGSEGGEGREQEARSSLASLGCNQIFLFNYDDTRTQYQIDSMIKSLEDVITNHIPPDVKIFRVYTMHDSDRHQDHRAVYHASIVACREIKQIFSYETPSIRLTFMPQVFEKMTEYYFQKKLNSLAFHKSQSHRDYMQADCLRTIARFRGQQAGCDLCEAFVVHKMVL